MKSILTGSIALLASGIFFAADKGGEAGSSTSSESETPKTTPVAPASMDEAFPVVETVEIELKKLVLDAGTQPRLALDEETIQEYTEVIKGAVKAQQPIPFPAIEVFRDSTGRCVPADGFHRIASHKKAHTGTIRANIRNGTERDAVLYSCSANTTHGVRRTRKDADRAAKILVNDPEWNQWSNLTLARLAGVSEFKIRELRTVAKSPATRKATRAGKTVTIDTKAIGKGKGGGKKGAAAAKSAEKKAAKAAAKGDKKGAGEQSAAAKKKSEEHAKTTAKADLDRDLIKIADAVGGTDGGKIRAAVLDGSLELSPRDVRDWASFSPKDIKNIAPLITGGARMRPAKAFDFVKSELSDKIVTELHNRALGNGGEYTYEADGVTITVTHKAKK